MRMEPFNGLDHIISLDCFTVMVPSAFVGLSLYDFQNPKDALVSFNYRTSKCNTHEILGTCHGGKYSNNVSINAVIKDLSEGESRTYGCNATYDNRLSYRTETYTINVTRPLTSVLTWTSSTTAHSTSVPPNNSTDRHHTSPTVASPRITTKTPVATNVAPQLVESGTTRGVGTKDSPIRVTEDTSVLFYLKAYPAPAFKSATFLGKTMLPNNSLEAHTGPKTFTESMIRCWPLSLSYRVQCEIVEHLEEGFYAVTLENEVDEITVYLQVDPKKSEDIGTYPGVYVAAGVGVSVVFVVVVVVTRRRYLARRTRYAQFQRERERESAFYRQLGHSLMRDDDADVAVDVHVSEGDRYYHVVNDSHLRPELEPGVYFRRHCRAPRAPRLGAPLPPLPLPESTRAVTSLRRCSSLPDDYLHPASSLSDRRAADKSTASRSHRRNSLPSDYLHPAAQIPSRGQSQSLDC